MTEPTPTARGTGTPRSPRLCRGLAPVVGNDALVLEGGPRRRRLTGTAATTIVPSLLALIDGATSPPELAANSGLGVQTVRAVLSRLDEIGLLEWTDRSAASQAPDDPAFTFFSRTISVTGEHTCAEQVLSALAASAVLIVADESIAEWIAPDLVASGVGDVRVRSTATAILADDMRALTDAARSVVVVFDADHALEETVAALGALPVPVVRFACTGDDMEIGPTFFQSWSTCVHCMRRGHTGSGWTPEVQGAGIRPGSPAGEMAAALMTADVLVYLTHAAQPRKPWQVRRFLDHGRATDNLDLIPEADCQTCGAGPGSNLAWSYERQQEIRPTVLRWPKNVSAEHRTRLAEMVTARTPMPPTPRGVLDDHRQSGATRGSSDDSRSAASHVHVGIIADILRKVAGQRTDGRRWAPSGGNLASVRVYVATADSRFGLPGNVVGYDDANHEVFALRRDPIPVELLLADTDLDAVGHDAVLIFVSEVGRLASKYEDFAVRLALLDAGCALLQLSLAAAVHNIGTTPASRWNGKVAHLLELDPNLEAVTAIVGLTSMPVERGEEVTCH